MKAKTRSSKEQAERLIQSVMTLQPEHDAQAKLTSSNLQRCTTSRVCVGIESDPTTLGRNAGLGPHHLKEMMKRLSKSRRLIKWRINASSTPQKGQQILFKGKLARLVREVAAPPEKQQAKTYAGKTIKNENCSCNCSRCYANFGKTPIDYSSFNPGARAGRRWRSSKSLVTRAHVRQIA